MTLDAKIYVMIDELSKHALCELLGDHGSCEHLPATTLRNFVRQRYENHTLEGDEIVFAWDNDGSGRHESAV